MTRKEIDKNSIRQRMASLESQSEQIQQELQREMYAAGNKILDLSKVGIGIVGGLIISTFIVKKLLAGSENKKRHHLNTIHKGSKRVYQRFRDEIIQELSGQALIFALSVLKGKLKEYKEKDEKV